MAFQRILPLLMEEDDWFWITRTVILPPPPSAIPICRSCCPVTCLIYGDGFARDYDPVYGVGSNYYTNGTWNIENAELTCTSSNGVCIYQRDHPDYTSTHYLESIVSCNSYGDQARHIINYENNDNYLFSEVEIGGSCSTLRLYNRQGGSNIQLGEDISFSGINIGDRFKLETCYSSYDDTLLSSGIFWSNVLQRSSPSQSYQPLTYYRTTIEDEGYRIGFGAGNISNKVTFDTLRYYKYYSHDLQDTEGFITSYNPSCPVCWRHGCEVDNMVFSNYSVGVWDFGESYRNEYITPIYGGDFPCKLDSINGNWVVNSGGFITGSGTNAVLILNKPVIDDDTRMGVHVGAAIVQEDPIRLIVDFKDSNNYHYVQIELAEEMPELTLDNKYDIKFYKVTDGSHVQLGDTEHGYVTCSGSHDYWSSPNFSDLNACITNNRFNFRSDSSPLSSIYGGYPNLNYDFWCMREVIPHNGSHVGVGTNTITGSGVKIYNIALTEYDTGYRTYFDHFGIEDAPDVYPGLQPFGTAENCNCRFCKACNPLDEMPIYYKVVLGGSIVNSGCDYCSSYLGTYILTHKMNTNKDSCFYSATYANPCIAYTNECMSLVLQHYAVNHYRLLVYLDEDLSIYWSSESLTNEYLPCTTYNDYLLPSGSLFTYNNCGFHNVTCKITAMN